MHGMLFRSSDILMSTYRITNVGKSSIKMSSASHKHPVEAVQDEVQIKPTGFRHEDDEVDPVAIIGFSARLPQDGETAEGFWTMLCEGRSAASRVPKERFNVDAFYHPDASRAGTVCY